MPAACRGIARGSTGLPPPNVALNCVREDQTRLEFGTRAVAAWRCCLAPRRASTRRTATRRGADDKPTTPGRWHWRLHPGAKRAVARATLASLEDRRPRGADRRGSKYANKREYQRRIPCGGPWRTLYKSIGTGACSIVHENNGTAGTARGTPVGAERPLSTVIVGRERTPPWSQLSTLRGCGALPLRTVFGILSKGGDQVKSIQESALKLGRIVYCS